MKKIGLFFLTLLFAGSITFQATAQWGWGKKVSGEGPVVTKKLDLERLDGIGVAIAADVFLKQGNRQEVTIKAQQNIIDLINRDVKEGNWEVELEDNVNLGNHKNIEVYVTLPAIKQLSIAGSGNIVSEDDFKNSEDLSVSIAGSGDIRLNGTGKDLKVSIAGSGDVKMANYKSRDCKVSIAGSGYCELYVDGDLNVSIAGSGDVRYKGNPTNVKSSIMGSGDVEPF